MDCCKEPSSLFVRTSMCNDYLVNVPHPGVEQRWPLYSSGQTAPNDPKLGSLGHASARGTTVEQCVVMRHTMHMSACHVMLACTKKKRERASVITPLHRGGETPATHPARSVRIVKNTRLRSNDYFDCTSRPATCAYSQWVSQLPAGVFPPVGLS
jgi:hypothetical protein